MLDVVTSYEEVKGASIMLQQRLSGDERLIEARARVARLRRRARPIPKPLRMAMKAEQDRAGTAREA